MNNSLLISFKIQLRVIYALLMREILTRFGKHNIGFLWLIVEPMMFTLGVTVLWLLATHKEGNLSVIAFVLTGYSSVILWRNCANRCAMAITPNLTLLYHRNVKVIDIFFSRIILELVGATISFIILLSVFIFLDLIPMPDNPRMIILGWILLCYYSISLAFLVGVISERSEIFERFWHVVTYLLFPVSGALYVVDWLPTQAQKIVLLFPSVHSTEMIREGYFGNTIQFHYDISYQLIVCSVMFLLALIYLRQTVKLI